MHQNFRERVGVINGWWASKKTPAVGAHGKTTAKPAVALLT